MSVAVQVPDTGRGVHKSRASFQKPIAAFVPIGQWVSVFAANGYCLLWRNLNVHIFLHVFEISLISARLTRRLPHGSFGFYLRTPRSLYVALRTRFCSASRSSISAAQSAQTCSPLRFVVTSLLIPTVAQDSHFILLPLSVLAH